MSLKSSHITVKKSIRKPEDDFFLLYVTYSEIFGKEPTNTDLLKRIRKYRLIDLIELLAKINMFLENDGAFKPKFQELQERLTNDLFSETTGREIFELLQQNGRIVFAEQQLLSLMKRIFIDGYAQAKNTLNTLDAVREFIPCCLMIPNIIEQAFLRRTKSATPEEVKKQSIIIFIQMLAFHATEVLSNLIGRYYQLFFKIPRMPQLRQSPNFIDLNEIFRKATSFDLELYFSLGFAVLSHFMSCSLLKGEMKPEDIFFKQTPYFPKTSVVESEAKRILDELSMNIEGFRKAFKDEEKTAPGSYYSFVPIRQKPLLRVSDEMVIPLSVRFLKEKITKGIYWTIHDYLPREDRTRFTNFFGKEIFQYYVESIFRERIYLELNGLAKRVFFDFKYGKPERTSPDVIIISPVETSQKSPKYDTVFIEVVSSRLKMKDTLTIGNYDAFVDDLEKIVIGKAGQLDGRIKDFKAGKFSLDNISATEIRTYYPVIVTIESLPQVPAIWNEIEKKLKSNDYLQAADIQRLQVLDIEDIEILESLLTQGVSLTEILREKNKDIEGRDLIFKHYLSKSRFGELKLDNEFLLGEVNELANKVKTLLFPGDSP